MGFQVILFTSSTAAILSAKGIIGIVRVNYLTSVLTSSIGPKHKKVVILFFVLDHFNHISLTAIRKVFLLQEFYKVIINGSCVTMTFIHHFYIPGP